MRHGLGLVEAEFEADAFRQAAAVRFDLLVQIVTHHKHIDAELALGADEHGALAVETREVARLVIVPFDLGDIANRQCAAGRRAQHRVPDLVETVERTRGRQVEAPAT